MLELRLLIPGNASPISCRKACGVGGPEAKPFSLNGRKPQGRSCSKCSYELADIEDPAVRKSTLYETLMLQGNSDRNTWAHYCRRPLHPHTNVVSSEPIIRN